MKKLDWYIFRTYVGPLVLTFLIAIFVLLMQFVWKYIDELVGKGLQWGVIAELLFYASTTFVPMALPLAILLSSLMTFGNLGEHNALVSMKSSGISLRRVMQPLIILSVLISFGAFHFSNIVLPITNLQFRSILFDVRQQKLAFNLKEGIYFDGLEGYVFRIGKIEDDGRIVRDVLIYDHTSGEGITTVTLAERGEIEQSPDGRFLVFTLYNGYSYDDTPDRRNPNSVPFSRIKFDREVRRFDLSGFELTRTDEDFFRNHFQMYNIRQLVHSRDSLTNLLDARRENFRTAMSINFYFFTHYDTARVVIPDTTLRLGGEMLGGLNAPTRDEVLQAALNATRSVKTNLEFTSSSFNGQQRQIRRHDIELHRKYTLSVACFILFFVGAPLGAIIRKGGLGMPLVVSTFLFIMFHIISTTGDRYVRSGVLDPWVGMWLSSAVFLPLGIWLTYKAVTDSPLMDADAWGKLAILRKRIIPFKKNSQHDQIDTATR
ncbi:MAG TPA: LptF/LptG family permease, partial [Bacteroidales bacterium]|nr:LptF/LptG family permease [Bacteroidales bacterium]